MPSSLNPNGRVSYLAIARVQRGLSQRKLAELVGMTQVGISHIETGHVKKPHALSQRAIAAALDYNPEELFPPAGKPSPSKELRALARAGRPW